MLRFLFGWLSCHVSLDVLIECPDVVKPGDAVVNRAHRWHVRRTEEMVARLFEAGPLPPAAAFPAGDLHDGCRFDHDVERLGPYAFRHPDPSEGPLQHLLLSGP